MAENSDIHIDIQAPDEGIIFITSKGVGYVHIPDREDDIEIAPDKTHTAFHKDTVRIKLLGELSGDRMQGEVVEVLKRARTTCVGTTFAFNGGLAMRPDDRHIPKDFILQDAPQLPANTKIYVDIVSWGDAQNPPIATIREILGPKGDHEAETKAILLSNNIDTRFPEAVEREAEKIKREFHISLDGRKDLRDRITCTIDPADAKDFDDALSLKDLGDGFFEVGIHIADVSHFVRPQTALDTEARSRGFSVYLVDRTIPMLPEILSNDLCSLNPHEDKYAFSAVFEMNLAGEIRSRWFGKSLIESNKRFSYEEAQEVLDGTKDIYTQELKTLEKIAQALRTKKEAAGAIDFDTEEIKFELDEHKKPIRIYKKERLETMRMVEEFMLLANREVAFVVAHPKNDTPAPTFIYRVHDLPNPEKIENLSIFLDALGYSLGTSDKHTDLTPTDVQKLLTHIEGSPEEATIKTAVLRSMAKASYSTHNIGHFGLAFSYYTHFTSPIRRYPDLMVHRALQNFLTHTPEKKDVALTYENILRNATEKEISAMNAERDSIRMKQVEYMQNHIGEIFEGTITGATEWGVYVEEKNTKSEGMIRLKDLGGDYFELDPKTYAVVGSKTKKKFAIGDKIQIRLVGVNIDERTIDWALVS